LFVRQQYRREYGKGLPHKKPIASETDACKMKSFARLGGLKEAPASIGGEYFTVSGYIIALIIVLPLVVLIAVSDYHIFSYYSDKNIVLCVVLCAAAAVLITGFFAYLLIFMCSRKIGKMRFSDFEEEELYRQHITSEKAKVLFTIKENGNNSFVMKHFQKDNTVMPVAYIKYNDKIGISNLDVRYLYSEIEKNNETIKICIIANKPTKTAVIVSISKNENVFVVNGEKVDKVHSADDTLNYNVYAEFLPFDQYKEISEVVIDNSPYQLVNSKTSKPEIQLA